MEDGASLATGTAVPITDLFWYEWHGESDNWNPGHRSGRKSGSDKGGSRVSGKGRSR